MSRHWLLAKAFTPVVALVVAACAPTEEASNATGRASVNAPTVFEGDVGQSSLPFTITSSVEQRIRYHTRDITAAAGSDFQYTAGEMTLLPGEVHTIDVAVNGDLQIESDEKLGMTLIYPDGSTSLHEGIILNDDRPTLSIENQEGVERGTGTSALRFRLRLTEPTLTDFPVRIVTTDESDAVIISEVDSSFRAATAIEDYVPVDRVVVFPSGSSEVTFEATVKGDVKIENNEAFAVKVFNSSANPFTDTPLSTAYGIILNDDGPGFNQPRVNLGTGTALEGNTAGSNNVNFTVAFSGSNEVDFALFYQVILTPEATSGSIRPADTNDIGVSVGTPIKFRDILTTDTLPITDTIRIPISGDVQYEASEVFNLVLLTSDGFELARSTGTIRNDDSPSFSLTQVLADPADSGTLEGDSNSNMQFLLTLEEPDGLFQDVTLSYRTFNGFSVDIADATASDYRSTTESVTFSPNDTENFKTIEVPIIGDLDYEPNEAFTLRVSLGSTPVVSAKGEITNDDDPTFEAILVASDGSTIGGSSIGESSLNESNTDLLIVKPYFKAEVTRDTTVFYAIKSGSADVGLAGETGKDVTTEAGVPLTGEFTYAEGTAANGAPRSGNDIQLRLFDDTLLEETQSFSISFYETASQRDLDLSDGLLFQLTISIADDDFVLVEFSSADLTVVEGTDATDISVSETILTVSNGVLTSDQSVPFVIRSGASATRGSDYEIPASLVIRSGDYSSPTQLAFEDLLIVRDDLVEIDESFRLLLIGTGVGSQLQLGSQTTIEITITDDDVIEVSLDNTTIDVTEGSDPEISITTSGATVDANSPPVTFEITIIADANTEAADYTFSDGTVTITDSGLLTFPAGDLFITVDDLVENAETLSVELRAVASGSPVTYADINQTQTLNITNTDSITVTLDPVPEVTEGATPSISVTTTGDTINGDSPPLSFEFTVALGTALLDDDYSFTGGLVTLNPDGSLTYPGSWSLAIVDDSVVEGRESFTLGLGSPSDFVTLGGTASISINDNDVLTATFINNSSLDPVSGKVRYETAESDAAPTSALRVTGDTVIPVTLEFEQRPSNPYQAAEGEGSPITAPNVDFILSPITVPGTHTSGDVYDFPVVSMDTGDTTTEFNESIYVALLPPGTTDQPVQAADPGNDDAAVLLIINDDLTNRVNGSGIDYCADEAGALLADCSTTVTALQSQDAKLSYTEFNSIDRVQGPDSASTPLNWQCLTDDKTGLTWAYEVPTVPAAPSTYNGSNSNIPDKINQMDGVCGNTDWRLPTFPELTNLMTFKTETGLLNVADEFVNVQVAANTDRYWFELNDGGTAVRRTFSFHQGQVTTGSNAHLILASDADALSLIETQPSTIYDCAVAAADPSEAPAASVVSDHRYTRNGSEITDNVTGLTWLSRSLLTSESDATTPTWGTALAQADTHLDGSWRSPTIKELLSLLTINCAGTPDTNLPHYFLPRTGTGGAILPVMSSSPVNNALSKIWAIDLSSDAALLIQSGVPAVANEMQTFLVKEP